MEEKIRGYIYKITNSQNGFCYIGKTTYQNIEKRFRQHKYYASIGGGSRESLHEAIRKYGEDKFTIELIDIVYSPKFLEDVEREYIKKYHTWIGDSQCKGYNQSKGGQGTHYKNNEFNDILLERILKTYEETKNQAETARRLDINVTTVRNYLKLNNIERDNAKTIAIRETGKKVAIYNENDIIAIYPSLGQAARHFIDKVTASHISQVCYNKRKHIKGYTAKFTQKPIFNEDYFLPTLEIAKNLNQNNKKPVVMVDINTNKILQVFESGSAAGRYFQMPKPGSATTCIKRAIDRDGTWRGYKWAYV